MSSLLSPESPEFIQTEMDTCFLNNTQPTSDKLQIQQTASLKAELAQSSIPTSTPVTSLPIKTQVVPLVYIQTPTKFQPISKPNSNAVPQLQFATLSSSVVNNKSTQNQSVILTPTVKTQQLVIRKPGNVQAVPVVPVSVSSCSKITGAYLTMLKQIPKLADVSTIGNANNSNNQSKPNLTKIPDCSMIQATNTSLGQKYVLAPMPKLLKNRLPMTVTTNTNNFQPKIAFMPLTLPSTSSDTSTEPKMINIKISNGQLQSENASLIVKNQTGIDIPEKGDNFNNNHQDITCDEVIDLDSPVKNEKEYELSIVEDSCSSRNEQLFTDSNKLAEIIKQNNKEQKFSKHGVSILKKNHQSYLDQKLINFKMFNNNQNSILDQSCEVTKEQEPEIVLAEPKYKPQKTERRRKSNFSYLKDYDDMEIILTTNDDNNSIDKFKETFENTDITLTKLSDCRNHEEEKKPTDFIEIEVIKEKTEIPASNDCDLQKILKWEEGIGSLPGTDLKFIINEFNLLEFVTEEEYKKILNKRLAKIKKSMNKEEMQEEMRCMECGCYGLPSEFINPKYCSYDCQETGNNKEVKERELKLKRKRKKGYVKKSDLITDAKIEKDSGSEDESNSNNENSQDRNNFPWHCTKKGFSWTKYLDHIKAKAAPVKLFKDPFPYNRNCFRPGMKLEGIDPQHPSYFCVLTVSEVCGYRIRLHFDGYPSNYDFWLNADSMDIFPAGWCEKYGHVLHPPPGYTVENFNWVHYLKQTKSTAAPKHLFANRAGNAICPNGFRVGMKLEAVDRKNTALVCVATVRDMMDNRILVRFDSWDDIYDYWADPTSPYIHPVGWCDQYGHNLTPPNDYPNPETFSWNKYLKETKSVAAPVRAFKQRPACGFRRGMRLECVDKRVPQLIRAATVDDVKGHQLRIHFDGWLDRYSYWVDDDSPDIHPVGWCQKTGHPIETPLTPFDIYDFLECPTVGCRGVGHIKGPKYQTHSEQKHCPYAEDNVDIDKVLPDRLLSPDSLVEAVVPVSREPKEKEKVKPRVGRPPKYLRTEVVVKEEEENSVPKPKRKYKKRKLDSQNDRDKEKIEALSLIEKSKIEPAEKESWTKHSRFLKNYINMNSNPKLWNRIKVADFVSSIPGCESDSYMFELQEIDGESFLSLNQKDLLDFLNMKLGPAIKLYNIIVLMRNNCNERMFS